MPNEFSPQVTLAKDTIFEYVNTGTILKLPKDLDESLLNKRAGVFVSIKKHGLLRGCIGTIEPVQDNLAEEIIANAISACSRDPRFIPVETKELNDLNISVDVLGEPEKITDLKKLDPKVYGVIVESGRRRGLLLPDLEGVDTVDEQIDIAMHKAGISNKDQVTLYRFEVKRYY